MQGFKDAGSPARQIGTLRFAFFVVVLVGMIVAYALIFGALADKVGWRDAYGFACRRKCLVLDMWHSRKLIEGGTGPELALFAMIWFFPAAGSLIGAGAVAARWLKRHRNRIRPLPRD